RAQVLPYRRHAAADAHVTSTGCIPRARERDLGTFRDEVKGRAALHLQGRPRIVCEHEHRHVIGRVLAPPAAPGLVRPRPAHRSEHVPSHDPRADVLERLRGEVIVEAGRSAFLAEHRLPEGAGGEEPGVERLPAAAERVLLVLRGTGAVAVYGDGKSSDAKSGHTRLPGEFGSGKDDREAREM